MEMLTSPFLKTCSLITYSTNVFPEFYNPWGLDPNPMSVMVDGVFINVSFWDTGNFWIPFLHINCLYIFPIL